jgi:hypothetical protein
MLAALEGETTYKGSGNWTYKYYDLQGPQAMRLFNQYPLVGTVTLARIKPNLLLDGGNGRAGGGSGAH